MITTIKYLIADSTSPYRNLAMEEYLMTQVGKNTCILYLWQDRNTVEIGRNQNARKELRLNEIQKNGARISRRLAGGGACFHDLGNLNFSFLTLQEEMDDKRLSGVILRAVRGLGIDAGRSESGILMADGRKFCNSVTYTKDGHSCYRGSIMVNSNLTRVCKYINPASSRVKSKGADSIRSKVVNLQECLSSLTVEALRDIVRAVSIPVVAIGGINAGNIAQLKGSNVDGAAVISAIFGAEDPGAATSKLLALAKDMVAAHG